MAETSMMHRYEDRSESYYESPENGFPRIGFNLINTPLQKSGIDACISSRITTVIQVVRDPQINYN